MVSLLGGASRALNDEFDTSLKGIETTLAERGQSLISEFQTRAEALDTGTEKLNAALEARARQINDGLVERASEIADDLHHGRSSSRTDRRKQVEAARRNGRRWSPRPLPILEDAPLDFAGRMEAARNIAAQALDTDLGKGSTTPARASRTIDEHPRKLAESGERMTGVMRPTSQRFTGPRRDGARHRRAGAQIGR